MQKTRRVAPDVDCAAAYCSGLSRANGGATVIATRQPRRISERMLENVAQFYLQRFAATAAMLRRVLLRRVERSARAHGTDRGEGAALVDAVVDRCVRAGLVDDRAFAAARAARLHRQGKPARAIAAHLRGKGVGRDLIEATLSELGEDEGSEDGPDWAAAIHFARRRRLGPYRTAPATAETHAKDLAAFARAGFSYAIARRILAAATPEELDVGEG